MKWSLRKGFKGWEIWEGEVKYDDCSFSFKQRLPSTSFDTIEELESWLQEEERKRGKDYLLRLLAQRNYSSARLRQKLAAKGIRSSIADELLSWLDHLGLVQDADYLRGAIEREFKRGFGPKAIEWKLRAQGIDPEAIRKEVQRVCTRPAQKKCIDQFVSKHSSDLKKTAAALQRRGFSSDLIYDALRESHHSR